MTTRFIPEVAVATPECPNPQQWQCIDAMATEREVLEFLRALVVMLKPKLIVETGTYLGYGTLYLAEGVSLNGRGHVYTADPIGLAIKQAKVLILGRGLGRLVSFHVSTGEQMLKGLPFSVDLAFLDSDLETRIGEMEALRPKLAPGAVIAVHDTNTFHRLPRKQFTKYAEANGFQAINFDTPRGLMLLREKPTL